MKQRDFEPLVRKMGFERAVMHTISEILAELAEIRRTFQEMSAYVEVKDKILKQHTSIMERLGVVSQDLMKTVHGNSLREAQIRLGVRVDSEAPGDAGAMTDPMKKE